MSILDSLQFANTLGLYALLSIIPLIIIYLLRPRPLKLKIPSLMFLMEIEKKKRLNIFRKFLKDPLFLIQLLVLLLVSFAIASPFIMSDKESGGGHTVIILDASASMQADNKFEKALEQANKFLSSKNTIILAESVPVMIMKEAPSGSASDALSKLKAKATSSDISSAVLLGGRLLPEGGRIVVLSDFSSFKGDDPTVSKKLAQSKGINVDFIKISGKTDNVGIVNGWFEQNRDYKLSIKNFNKETQNININVKTNNQNVLSTPLSINGNSIEYFSITNLNSGITQISINSQDSLLVDNNAYVIIPESANQNILYITENEKTPSLLALSLIQFINIEKKNPNNIPSLSGYSVVFVSSPIQESAISDYVKNGGNVVIIAHNGLKNMDILPVEIGEISNKTSLNIIRQTKITEGINFENIDIKKHFNVKPKNGAITLIEGGDKSAILTYWNFGRGSVFYFGISDPSGNIYDPLNENVWTDFHTYPEYPLFWKNLLEWISGSRDVSEYNAKTGSLIKLSSETTIKTPQDSITTDTLLLDEVGIFQLPDKEVAVNLYDEKESDLSLSYNIESSAGNEIPYNIQIIRSPEYFDIYLIIFAMFLVIFELYYLRHRGEL